MIATYYNNLLSLVSGWWYIYPSEKYEFVNGKDDIPYIMETTNQLFSFRQDDIL